ncbi:mitochondrial substrate carrier family protein [Emiliania huxleyi CCMP1516]|uniref:Mitochondrial substrate carrier family protein n=2 Tax=Emiliania huxleyi TaxID=2903 RepID=A0A0D3J154_EMIH1|nr:mitochondrial substrate carrier family protein [Emiliania huxleyi CCMP1516]EOD17239.1 mitochondrial substrate carrier family protein [Emiliania huxleyi CCMP1516]|eukprot:XP_005769668.1 mitochondrial substrate carrier family protein [Emiliania huxleyi CCMP1516]
MGLDGLPHALSCLPDDDEPSFLFARGLFASFLSAGIGAAVTNPLELVKVRWQVTPESMRTATNMSGFASEIVAKEGVMRGISVNFMAIGVSAIGRVGLYPTVRDVFVGARGGDVAKPTPGDMFISGLLAGAIGYFIATPVFAQKTIIQAEAGLVDPKSGLLTTGAKAGSAPTSPNGWIAGMAAVAKKDGIGGWFKGSGPLVVRGATLSAGNQLGYDGFKTATSGVLPEGTRAADLRSHTSSLMQQILASIMGALGSTVCATPADVVTTRYLAEPGKFASPIACATTIMSQEGLGFPFLKEAGFYRGSTALFVKLAPLYMLSLPLNEGLRSMLGLSS